MAKTFLKLFRKLKKYKYFMQKVFDILPKFLGHKNTLKEICLDCTFIFHAQKTRPFMRGEDVNGFYNSFSFVFWIFRKENQWPENLKGTSNRISSKNLKIGFLDVS